MGPEEQSEFSIDVIGHIEFGGHTQYQIKCKVQSTAEQQIVAESCSPQSSGAPSCQVHSWGTIRRLVHLREGLHDPLKHALRKRYEDFFEKTPFAHHTGVPGTTERLRGWLTTLTSCINSGVITPYLVA